MKSAEARDAMVARVKTTFKKFPTFASLPMLVGKKGNQFYKLPLPDFTAALPPEVEFPVDEALYLTALHNVCADGLPIGRGSGADKYVIIWDRA